MSRRQGSNKGNFSKQGNPYNILPPSTVLDEYEEISPGSVRKLLEMASREQEHRHNWQEEHLRVHGRIHKWGQIFAFAYNVLLLFLIGYLIDGGNSKLAIKLFIINAILMSFALLVTFIERRIMNRRPPRKIQTKYSNPKNSNRRRGENRN